MALAPKVANLQPKMFKCPYLDVFEKNSTVCSNLTTNESLSFPKDLHEYFWLKIGILSIKGNRKYVGSSAPAHTKLCISRLALKCTCKK